MQAKYNFCKFQSLCNCEQQQCSNISQKSKMFKQENGNSKNSFGRKKERQSVGKRNAQKIWLVGLSSLGETFETTVNFAMGVVELFELNTFVVSCF